MNLGIGGTYKAPESGYYWMYYPLVHKERTRYLEEGEEIRLTYISKIQLVRRNNEPTRNVGDSAPGCVD